MISFSDFNCNNAIADNTVGISITNMIKKEGLRAYGTQLARGRCVGCHSHTEDEEWYIIISGEGAIWTAEVMAGELKISA
ncbi:cupin domain-containing protein [Yersinia mollaretii]|uniref:hypothetical protein n=1 Tax=Yersinia mollaretii TaxID=33060 RepID=UPI0021BDA06F|nr:hypothetical protein [Yersinia mollaretii]